VVVLREVVVGSHQASSAPFVDELGTLLMFVMANMAILLVTLGILVVSRSQTSNSASINHAAIKPDHENVTVQGPKNNTDGLGLGITQTQYQSLMALLQNMSGSTFSGSVDNPQPNQVNMTYSTQMDRILVLVHLLVTYTNMHSLHILLIIHPLTHTHKNHTLVHG